MDPFDNIPTELIIEQGLRLDTYDLIEVCQVSKKFNQAICDNDEFWRQKYIKDLGSAQLTWKDKYKTDTMIKLANEKAMGHAEPSANFYYRLAAEGNEGIAVAILKFMDSADEYSYVILGYLDNPNRNDEVLDHLIYLIFKDVPDEYDGPLDYMSFGYLLATIKKDEDVKLVIESYKRYAAAEMPQYEDVETFDSYFDSTPERFKLVASLLAD